MVMINFHLKGKKALASFFIISSKLNWDDGGAWIWFSSTIKNRHFCLFFICCSNIFFPIYRIGAWIWRFIHLFKFNNVNPFHKKIMLCGLAFYRLRGGDYGKPFVNVLTGGIASFAKGLHIFFGNFVIARQLKQKIGSGCVCACVSLCCMA